MKDAGTPGISGRFGDSYVVRDLEGLDRACPPDGTGVRDISWKFLEFPAADVFLRTGERFFAEEGSISKVIGSGPNTLQADTTSAMYSGPISIENIVTGNANASGSVLAWSDLGGVGPAMDKVGFFGTTAGTISNFLSLSAIQNCAFDGFTTGLSLSGTIVGAQFFRCAWFGSAAASFIGVDVPSGVVIVSFLQFENCAFLSQDPGQFMARISDTAVVPTAAPPTTTVGLFLDNNRLEGPGQMLEQGVGFIGVRDMRLLSRTNFRLGNSGLIGDIEFNDSTNFVTVVHDDPLVTPGTFIIVPATSGVGPGLQVTTSNERFTLVINAASDWFVRYDGPEQDVTFKLEFSIEYRRAGGGTDRIVTCIEVDPDGDNAGWLETAARGSGDQDARARQVTGSGIINGINPGAGFRLTMDNEDGLNNTEVIRYTVGVRAI